MTEDCEWRDDLELRISRDLGLPCGDITISATGPAATLHPKCLGVYKPTGKFSAGRRIFKHVNGKRVLMTQRWKVGWGIRNNEIKDGSYMISSCAPSLCPADTRAQTSGRFGYIFWQFNGKDGWENGNIIVKCSVHNK